MDLVRKVRRSSEGSLRIPFGRSNTISLDFLGGSNKSLGGASNKSLGGSSIRSRSRSTSIGRPNRRGRRKSKDGSKPAGAGPELRRSNTAPVPTHVRESFAPEMISGFESTETTTINSADELQHVIQALALNSKQEEKKSNNNRVVHNLMDEGSIQSAVVMVKQFWRLINEQQPQEAFSLIEEDVQDIERNWDAIYPKLFKNENEEETNQEEEPTNSRRERRRRRSRRSPFNLRRNFTK